MLIPE